jgi:transcription elongation factor Elf1
VQKREVPEAAGYGLPEHVTCPFCNGERTELHSAFGPQLSVATYWCLVCRSPFEWIKWNGRR